MKNLKTTNDVQRYGLHIAPGYALVTKELRAMGMDDLFIMEFLDSGKADDIAEKAAKIIAKGKG